MSRIRTSILILVVLFAPAAALAQSWPTAQPIKAIITFSAGSASDVIARAVFDQVSTQIGQTIVVENRVGAGGTLGANAVAKAPPDGYTLLVHTSSHTVAAATYAQLPYDTAKDFAAVIPLANLPNVLIVAKAKGYKSARDLVGAAKGKPGSFNYASAGAGTASHFNAERFKLAAKFDAQHVPFKGAPEALREIVAEPHRLLFRTAIAGQRAYRGGSACSARRQLFPSRVSFAGRSNHGGGRISQFGV